MAPIWQIYLLLVFILAVLTIHGQVRTKDSDFGTDTNYIANLSDRLAVRIYGINKFNRFDVKENNLDQEVSYAPNDNLNLGFQVNYKWFGLGIAFNFPFINNDNDIYGKTSRLDAQTNIFTRKFIVDVYLSHYQGFYIENPESYLDDWETGDPYPQRPDVYTSSVSGSFTWVFNNDRYSGKAAFVQTELQRKSAGSFLAGGFFTWLAAGGDSALVPSGLAPVYNPDLLFNQAGILGLGASFGYSHTFVMWKKLYFSLTLAPGFAYQHYQVGYTNDHPDHSGNLISGRIQSRVALVFNSRRSFAGIMASNDSYSANTGKEQRNSLNFELGAVRFFYGRRFGVNWKFMQ